MWVRAQSGYLCRNWGCVAKKVERTNCACLSAREFYSVLKPKVSLMNRTSPTLSPFGNNFTWPFPAHVDGFVTFNGPLRSVEGPESPTGVDPSLDGPVVLFHDVVHVWTSATSTALAHFSLRRQWRGCVYQEIRAAIQK